MTELAENPQDSFDPCLARRCSARTIVDAAADGTLTADRITDLIAEAARAQSIATYTGELRQRTERLFVGAFYEALQDGAADEILDSLRPAFDTAAEAFLHSAKPEALHAWQQLDTHRPPSTPSVASPPSSVAAPHGSRWSRSTHWVTASGSPTGRSSPPTAPTSNRTAPRSAAPTPDTAPARGSACR